MVQEQNCRPSEATARLWAEAWAISAFLLMFFFLVVGDLVDASILGIRARNRDCLNNMFHPKAALEGSFDRA